MSAVIEPLGWPVGAWCKRVGISAPTFYRLGELQPRSVKIRERRLILERPEDYLKRVAEQQSDRAA